MNMKHTLWKFIRSFRSNQNFKNATFKYPNCWDKSYDKILRHTAASFCRICSPLKSLYCILTFEFMRSKKCTRIGAHSKRQAHPGGTNGHNQHSLWDLIVVLRLEAPIVFYGWMGELLSGTLTVALYSTFVPSNLSISIPRWQPLLFASFWYPSHFPNVPLSKLALFHYNSYQSLASPILHP